MKRKYTAPLVEVVRTETEQMICESLTIQSTPYNSSSMSIADKEDYDDEETVLDELW